MAYFRYKFLIILIIALGAMANASSKKRCSLNFMYDPCAADSYSVVDTERFVRGHHNCMAIAHYFPGEEPDDYCERGGRKGKNLSKPKSHVAPVR